jgi:hypothetical protein
LTQTKVCVPAAGQRERGGVEAEKGGAEAEVNAGPTKQAEVNEVRQSTR